MDINNLETFKGLINKFDIDDSKRLRASSIYLFLEEATCFVSSLLNKKIDLNFDKKLKDDYSGLIFKEYKTVYILTDLKQLKDNFQITHKLYLALSNSDSKDQLVVIKKIIVNGTNLESIYKNKPVIETNIFSAFKGLVKKEDCDQMSHMNVQYYFGKHSDAIKILFNKISNKISSNLKYQIVNERCIFSKEVSLGHALEFVFNIKKIDKDNLVLLTKVFCIDNKNVSAYFETNISLIIDDKVKTAINEIFSLKSSTYLNELEFKDLRSLSDERPSNKQSKNAFVSCKKAVNTWDLDYELMGSNQFKIGCVSDAATHLFTYCGADYNWRTKYNIGSAALDYSVRYYKKAPLGMAVTMYTNFTKIGNKSLKFIHHMVDDASGDVIMDIEIVAVLFDLKKRKAMEVPDNFRNRASTLLLDNQN